MVWSGSSNPISDFWDEWTGCVTSWGRLSVATYYAFCSLAVLVNLSSLFLPLRWDLYACPLANVTPSGTAPSHGNPPHVSQEYAVLLLHLWEVTLVFLFGALLVLPGGGRPKTRASLRSIGVVASYWAAVCLVHYKALRGSSNDDGLDCIRTFWPAFGGAHTAAVLVMLASKLVDEYVIRARAASDNAGGGETAPLTTNAKS